MNTVRVSAVHTEPWSLVWLATAAPCEPAALGRREATSQPAGAVLLRTDTSSPRRRLVTVRSTTSSAIHGRTTYSSSDRAID
jgi:hypothetical protein